MSRRQITRTKFDDQGNIIPEVVAVVSAKNKIPDENNPQKYFKRNYFEAIKKIIPPFYLADEKEVSGTHVPFTDQLINSHIVANKEQATILPVSSLAGNVYLSSIGTPEGFSKFFHKTFPPASIRSDDFERNILNKLGQSYQQFDTSASFGDYVSGTLLPSIPSLSDADQNLATLTASSFDNTSSGTYAHLVTNLGWAYFLNRAGTNEFTPSDAVAQLMVDTLWQGRPVVLEDLINIYQEHIWRGEASFSGLGRVLPVDYLSSLSVSTDEGTSGTQLLDRLKILNTINYSPHYVDSADTKIEDAFTTFFDTSGPAREGTYLTDTREAGPLARFLEAVSFSFGDRLTEQDELGILYDIGKCPDEFLELLAELIGWRFIGADVDKWRVQLRNAVEIYKMKGTRRSIQILLDTLFSTGVFSVTTSDTLSELWESYVPDLLYFALASNSAAFRDFNTYTQQQATKFSIPYYDAHSMETNLKHAVDKIIFDLVREFPGQFLLGGKSFPLPQFVISGTEDVYTGPYHLMDGDEYAPNTYMTGNVHDSSSVMLELMYDPEFVFNYRGGIHYVPPYEKRQYYTQSMLTTAMVDRLEFHLRCYGCREDYARSVTNYIRENTSTTVSIDKVLNNFLIFTKEKTYPPNYAEILESVTKQRTPDPASLLSIWNGKSSHFFMSFDASTFDFKSSELTSKSAYGITSVLPVLNQVIPAHAIPEILLSVSSVADALDVLADNDCREWRPNFDDLYEGSSTVTTGFSVCAVDMGALAGANAHRFKRTEVDNVNDLLLSGTTYQPIGTANRNSLRRRNFHNLLPETKMFTRNGRNNPGSLELSSPYYSSGIGYLPLGFMPSSLSYRAVDLKQNTNGFGIGKLLNDKLDPVWDICQNLTSPSSMFGYDISNTFASRAKQDIASSDCNTYGRRGQLQEIVWVMNKVHNEEKFLQASSIVSGYFDEWGQLNPKWPSSDPLLTPTDLSAWFAETHLEQVTDLESRYANTTQCIANYLNNQEASDDSLNYYEHFRFGYKIFKLYDAFNKLYKAHGTTSNYNLIEGPNIFSHTYGPLIYNSNLEINGSGLDASSYLAASSPIYEVDISYYGGSGILSISGVTGEYEVGTSAVSGTKEGFVGGPEFRNPNLVSAIEFVDTSVGNIVSQHPVFSLFNLSRNSQHKWSFNKRLIHNQIIKYHRPSSSSSFPRIRVPINPDSGHISTNMLQPNHDYEVTVKCHNLDVSGPEIGGLSLGMWVHTEPEMEKMWSYATPIQDDCGNVLDRWKEHKVVDLSGDPGISVVESLAQVQPFRLGNLEEFIFSGEGGGYDTIDHVAQQCWNPWVTNTTIVGANPLAIANINDNTLDTLTFRFSTKNNKAITPNGKYTKEYGKVHRTDQKYAIEFFIMTGDNRKFVAIEDISIIDKTNESMAAIQTEYGDISLGLTDLKTIFRYFRDLSNGLASRDAYNTSAVMEVSGGSRLNYRSNTSMYPITQNLTWKQLEEITINEG